MLILSILTLGHIFISVFTIDEMKYLCNTKPINTEANRQKILTAIIINQFFMLYISRYEETDFLGFLGGGVGLLGADSE